MINNNDLSLHHEAVYEPTKEHLTPMRILQVIPGFSLGGIEKAGCVLGEEMARTGHTVQIVGFADGPRRRVKEGLAVHSIAYDLQSYIEIIRKFKPNVVHLHGPEYNDALISTTEQNTDGALIVSTPVFGRPPKSVGLFERTRTCCVGMFTFRRLCRWLRMSLPEALERGMGYVPLTPFEPVSRTNDTKASCRERFGVATDAFIVGRIGRDTEAKWHPRHETLIDGILQRNPRATWLSVGLPESRGKRALALRWGKRFINLPETADYSVLSTVFRALDLQVFFSRHGECFASTICEAAGFGVPTVALSTPWNDNGQAEQVIDSVTGYLVSGVDEALDTVERIGKTPEDIEILGASAKQYALKRWAVERVVQDLVALYAYWSGSKESCSYLMEMQVECEHFDRNYRERMVHLLSQRHPLIGRILATVGSAAIEFWPVFVAGRTAKRWWKRRLPGERPLL